MTNATVLIMLVLAAGLTLAAYLQGPSLPLEGLRAGGKLLWDIFPTLILAFVAAGMITVVLPREFLSRWLGDESGVRGLVIASVAGWVTPGGPFVQFPIVAALLKAGAGVAPVVAYLSAWALMGLQRFIIFEVPLLGWKLSVCRLAASLVFPIVIGLLTRFIYLRV